MIPGAVVVDFYPRPPRGGRRQLRGLTQEELGISIHALREEGDVYHLSSAAARAVISIHALREEGDRRPMFRLCP